LDYTTPIWGQPDKTYPVFAQAMDAMNAASAVLVQDYPTKGLDESKIYYQNDASAFGKAAAERGLPAAICATIPENLDEDTRRFLIGQGIAPMQGIHETLNAIGHAATWQTTRELVQRDCPSALLSVEEILNIQLLTEDKGKAYLASLGVEIPIGQTLSEKEACTKAADFNYPVVLKMMSHNLIHKTEAGAVVLNITCPNDLIDEIAKMKIAVQAYKPNSTADSFLIEEMSATPLAELIVTLRSDSQFGPALVLGSGGILTELVGDAVTVLLPAKPQDIEQALQSLRTAKLLDGFRGRPKADLTPITHQIHDLCTSYMLHQHEISEIEINPMFVYQKHLVAIDALIQVAAS
jgi:acyl-CoA synthetase (NDP forming)